MGGSPACCRTEKTGSVFNKDKHMRKGPTLLVLAALALAASACLTALGNGDANAAALEPTDSGAPSAIVMFPVGEKPNPKAAAMKPVAFNHVIHEKWMNKTGRDCMACHHTGDPVACTECHTVYGSEKGGYVTLYKAMHTPTVAKRAENTPASCVSCHENRLKQRNCAGCHQQLVNKVCKSDNWCNVCHTITPAMTMEQMQEGMENKLPEAQNEKLADETAIARKPVQYWSTMLAPYKVDIDTLKGKYEACIFNHRHHVYSLMERIRKNRLAGAFHTTPATICVTCHHHSPASATPPKCSSCHQKNIDRNNPGKPSLMAAFHRQCMSCHTDMKVARPLNTDCETCHKLRPVQDAGNQGGI